MMKYKGINVEKIKEIQRVKLPNADAFIRMTPKDIENICSNTDSFDAVCNQIKKELEARKNDTEMAIICEMALNYLQSMKDKEATDDEAYNKGLNDAWELAKKLYLDTTCCELRKIYEVDDSYDEFGFILRKYTMQEALSKLEAYEKEIEVGDVVEGVAVDVKGVVLKVRDNYIYILFRDGTAGQHEKEEFKKTGKHIDIQKILEQIAGD